jgi:hypothetical protein
MILHLVSTEAEQSAFARAALRAARQNCGAEITLSPGATMADLHAHFSRAYMLLDDGPHAEHIPIAGFALHSLSEFAQSHPEPALSHLCPGNVFEIGHLWCTRNKLRPLLKGLLILSGLLQFDALLIYPVMTPRDYTAEFKTFRRVTKPIAVSSRDKAATVWIQGMLLEADDLRVAASQAMGHGFKIQAGFQSIEFMGGWNSLEDDDHASGEAPASEFQRYVN